MAHERSSSAWQDAIVVLERPSPRRLTGLSRGARWRRLSDSSRAKWDRVLKRLREEGLADQVTSDEPTSFNVLPVRGTERALECIRRMPGVQDVLPATAELEVDLLGR
jgi:hypothetical protein